MSYLHREIIDGKEAFSLRFHFYNLGTQIITHLPDELIERADHTFLFRILDYKPSEINQEIILRRLAAKIRKESEAHLFFYPDYLLPDGLILSHVFKQILACTSQFEIKDYVYSLDSHPIEFYSLSITWHKWRIFKRRAFNQRVSKLTRAEFESRIFGRARFIYVDSWNQHNKFFLVQDENHEVLVLTDVQINPLMILFP